MDMVRQLCAPAAFEHVRAAVREKNFGCLFFQPIVKKSNN
jgi:hypothetical protein